MLITINELLNSGLPISDELSDAKLSYCIQTAELYVLKPRLGDQTYLAILDQPSQYAEVINGGVVEREEHGETKYYYLNGLKRAMYELSFAYLLFNDITATIFGSVLKSDDYSKNVGREDLLDAAKMHYEIGLAYIKEVTDWLGINNEVKELPSFLEDFI